MPNSLMAAMDKEPKGIEDIRDILKEITKMNGKLRDLYNKTVSGN
jgi:hypothetical protein